MGLQLDKKAATEILLREAQLAETEAEGVWGRTGWVGFPWHTCGTPMARPWHTRGVDTHPGTPKPDQNLAGASERPCVPQ